MTETFVHVGTQPIIYKNTSYTCGDRIEADAADMAFFLTIGAVERVTTPPVDVPARVAFKAVKRETE